VPHRATLASNDIVRLFARATPTTGTYAVPADALPRGQGDVCLRVTHINDTNDLLLPCKFCAFQGRTHEDLRGSPYDLASGNYARAIERGIAGQ